MKVKIKRLSEKVKLPEYAHSEDACMDIIATSKKIVNEKDFGYIEYGTDLAFQLPEGYYMDIRPRSSISNTGMILANSCGTLDMGYTGELKCRFKWIPGTKQYEIGEKIAQIAIVPYPKIEWEEVSELEQTSRSDGGFGSTDKTKK